MSKKHFCAEIQPSCWFPERPMMVYEKKKKKDLMLASISLAFFSLISFIHLVKDCAILVYQR